MFRKPFEEMYDIEPGDWVAIIENGRILAIRRVKTVKRRFFHLENGDNYKRRTGGSLSKSPGRAYHVQPWHYRALKKKAA